MNVSEETIKALGESAEQTQLHKGNPRIKDPNKKRQIITYAVTPNTHKRMKLFSLENNTSLQQMIDEAMDLFFVSKFELPIEKISAVEKPSDTD